MTTCSLTENLAGASIKGRIERESTVAKVLKTMAFRAAGRKRQDRIFSIQGLNRRFLVDREHRYMLRWIDVQPDNIGRLALKLRVVASQVATQPMRFEPVFGPHPRNPHMRDVTEFFGQFSLAPVRRTVGGLFLNRPFKNARLLAFAIRTRQTSHMARTQPAKRSAKNRLFQRAMKLVSQSNLLRITLNRSPASISRISRARRACAALYI